MKAYVLRSKKTIEPFGDHPRDCLIVNKTLAELQREAFLRNGIEPVCEIADAEHVPVNEECVLFGESLYFTPELLGKFIAESRRKNQPTTCALLSGLTTERTAVGLRQGVAICPQGLAIRPGHVEYDLRYFPKGEARKLPGANVEICPDDLFTGILVPNHMCVSGHYLIPMTDLFAIQIDHWVNLWVASIVTILADGARLKHASKLRKVYLALRARSFNRWKILRSLNKIGSDCDIHPTAYIEGSTIGSGCVIGAGTVIRESVIGRGVTLGNGVVVEESVIGNKCTILNGHILYSVMYPSSFSVSGMISASLVGRGTFVGLHSTLTDFRFDGKNITVLRDGVLCDSGNMFLGSCLGHGVYLGSGCVVAPGRAVPNNQRIVLGKEMVFSASTARIPEQLRKVE